MPLKLRTKFLVKSLGAINHEQLHQSSTYQS